MLTKIHCFTLVMISIACIFNLQSSLASTAAGVKFDGKRFSVHANGVPLEQLLSMVEKQTGIQFSYDKLLAETNVFANFENNSLDDGMRRILLQFNYAVIYTESGHIKAVLVLNRQRASSKIPGNMTELRASLQETEINDTLGQFEPLPNDISDTLADQEDAGPFSEQLSEKGPSERDIPPGANEDGIPPPGDEAQSPVVDPNQPPPPGEESIEPEPSSIETLPRGIDPNVSPPPGDEPLYSEPPLEPE